MRLRLRTICGVEGCIRASPGPQVAYTWGANGLVSERFLTGAPYSLWYHFGPQGETRNLTNMPVPPNPAAIVDSYLYTAYGEPVASTGTDRNPFRYGGQVGYYTGPGAGIVLCGARWYNPYTARWMTRDPIGYAGGADLYAYCGENPVGGVDPDGLLWQLPGWVRAGARGLRIAFGLYNMDPGDETVAAPEPTRIVREVPAPKPPSSSLWRSIGLAEGAEEEPPAPTMVNTAEAPLPPDWPTRWRALTARSAGSGGGVGGILTIFEGFGVLAKGAHYVLGWRAATEQELHNDWYDPNAVDPIDHEGWYRPVVRRFYGDECSN